MRRALRILALVAAASAIAVAAAVSWLAFSPSAAHWLVYQLAAAFDGRLEVGAVEGSLARGITIRRIAYRQDDLRVDIDRAEAAWEWSALLDFHARFRRLALGEVSVKSAPSKERAQLPASLALPLKLSVDQGRIDRLVIASDGQPFVVEDIDFRGSASKERHVIDAIAIRVFDGRVTGKAQIGADPPFELKGDLAYSSAAESTLTGAQLSFSGTLSELQAKFNAAASWLVASGAATLSPFETILVKHLAAQVDRFVPRERFPDVPQMELRGRIDARQVAEDRFEGDVALENGTPGEFAEQKIPFSALAAHVSGNADAVEMTGLELALPRGQAFNGEGRYAAGALALDLATRALDLKAFDKRLVATRLSGSIKLNADAEAQSLIAVLTERNYRIEADVTRRGAELTVKRASAQARGGSLALTGEMALEAPHAFTAHGRLQRFDPSAFFESPRARINAEIAAKGTMTPGLSAQLTVKADGTGPRGESFTADARGLVRPKRVSGLRARLVVGRNVLTVEGAYGAPSDTLALDANLRALNDIDKRFGGAIEAKGHLSGDIARPEVRLEASGSRLAAPGNLRIGALQLRAALPNDWNKPIDFEATATDLQVDETRAAKALVVVRGTPRAHSIEASAMGKTVDARMRLTGGLSSMTSWSGEIAQLEMASPTKLSMLAPARLTVSPERIEAGGFTIVAMDARVNVGQIVWTPDMFRTNGEFAQLKVAPFLAPWSRTLRTTLVLTGNFTVDQRGGVLRGDVNVHRDAGDVVLSGVSDLPLALTDLRVEAHAENNRIRASARATSSSLGEVRATVATEAVRSAQGWALPASAPLAIEAQGDFASVAWLGPLIDPAVSVSGTMTLRAAGQGTVGEPRIDGAIEGKALSLRMPSTGIALTDGEISTTVANDRVVVKALRFKGGDGFLAVNGEASLRKGTSAQLRIEARKLLLVNRRDAKLELDATGDVTLAEGTVRLKGDARIIEGHLDLLRKAGMPSLAPDIHVKSEKPAPPPRQPMRIFVDVTTDFGDRFAVTAHNLGVGDNAALKTLSGDFKARIAGKIRTLSNEKQIPQTTGQLRVIDGAYTALGRSFRVERGNLSFVGPINNPSLDIFVAPAVTKLQFTPEVGISITGTAQAPRVRLVSQPDMPETEKLSWLLFGRGGQSFDFAVGATTGQIASPAAEFGWQLSQKLYVAYEQGATGTANIVRFYSQLTDRIAIQLGTGDANSLFLLYTFTFR